MIRIAGRISDELLRNGGLNWDEDYRKMLAAFQEYLRLANPIGESVECVGEIVDALRDGDVNDGKIWGLRYCAEAWVENNPENTEYIGSVCGAGKLIGCGNGMQYFGAILIKSELSREALEAYYSNYAEHDWECVVEHQVSAGIQIDGEQVTSLTTDLEGGQLLYRILVGEH